MNYIISPFLITELTDTVVIQNSNNTVVLKDCDVIDLFKKSEDNNKSAYTYEELEGLFMDRTDQVISFLTSNRLIKKEKPKIIQYQDINIVSNDANFLQSISFNSKGIGEEIHFQCIDDEANNFEIVDTDNLYVIFLNPFQLSTLERITSELKRKNVLVKTCFYYNHRIYISNFYKHEWYNPCPMCFYGSLEATLRGQSKTYNTVPFQGLIDYIYHQKSNFKIQNDFTNYQLLLFIDVLMQSLNIEKNSNINLVNYVDFNNKITLADEAIYWELCDCYE